MRAIRKHYPLIVALVIFFLVLVIELLKALHKDEGHFIYKVARARKKLKKRQTRRGKFGALIQITF